MFFGYQNYIRDILTTPEHKKNFTKQTHPFGLTKSVKYSMYKIASNSVTVLC
jgi:hypothetical protein